MKDCSSNGFIKKKNTEESIGRMLYRSRNLLPNLLHDGCNLELLHTNTQIYTAILLSIVQKHDKKFISRDITFLLIRTLTGLGHVII